MTENRLTSADLERLIDFVTAGFIILDPDWTITYINEFAAKAMEEGAPEALGQTLWDCAPAVVGTEIHRRLIEAKASGKTAEFEARSVYTGSWLRIHVYPSDDAIIVYFSDITLTHQTTTRIETEHAVTRVLASTSSLQEAAPRLLEVICECLELNAGGLWLPSGPEEQLCCAEFVMVACADEALPRFKKASLRATFAPGEGLPGQVYQQKEPVGLAQLSDEFNLRRIRGVKNPFRSGFAFPILADDRCLGVLEFFAVRPMDFREPKLAMMAALGRDIGQFMLRWQAQHAFNAGEAMRSAVLESALDAIVIMDEHGLIQEFNPAAERIFGYQRHEVLGQRLSDYLIPPDSRQRHEKGYRRLIETGVPHILGKRIEIEAMRADQTVFPCELAITQAWLKGQAPTFVGYVRDITARKQTEDSLIQAREQAEHITRLKSSLLANMSHEIRTPLTSMMIWTTVLRESVADAHLLSDTQMRAMSTIERSAQRLADTLDSVLTLAQLEGRALEPEMQSVSIVEVAREVVDQFQASAAAKDLEISLNAPDEPPFIEADPVFLNRILTKLASNAIKFTEAGEISVSIRQTEGQVILDFRDTGIGISPQFLPTVFDDFVQESTGFSRSYEGTGLGLAISKRLIEAMNGEIQVESEKGRGTTFTLIFDRLKNAGQHPRSQPFSYRDLPGELEHRVLLVEDNDGIREATAEALGVVAQVSAFVTAEDALECAKTAEFDLVLMDISLPGMDGLQALAKLRQLPAFADTPVIALTGHAMPGDREYLVHHGFSDYLAKPFKIKELIKQVKRWISGPPGEP